MYESYSATNIRNKVIKVVQLENDTTVYIDLVLYHYVGINRMSKVVFSFKITRIGMY